MSRLSEVVDSSSLRFLTASALEARREEEEQEKEKVMEELDVHMRIPWNQLTPDQRAVTSKPRAFQAWKAWSAARAAGRRRKKRKKKKLPKTSSHSSSGRARCRLRQWHVQGSYCWFYASLCVPFGCRQARGQVGMDQKNNNAVGWFYW